MIRGNPTPEDVAVAVLGGCQTGQPVIRDGQWRTACCWKWEWTLNTGEPFPTCLACNRPATWLFVGPKA